MVHGIAHKTKKVKFIYSNIDHRIQQNIRPTHCIKKFLKLMIGNTDPFRPWWQFWKHKFEENISLSIDGIYKSVKIQELLIILCFSKILVVACWWRNRFVKRNSGSFRNSWKLLDDVQQSTSHQQQNNQTYEVEAVAESEVGLQLVVTMSQVV